MTTSPPLDSGPAYPVPLMAERESDTVVNYDCLTGMSLRDHFATHAMAAIIAKGELEIIAVDAPDTTPMEVAIGAYTYADAMLRARDLIS